MDLTSSLVFLPLCILLKAEIMKSTNIQVPECRLDGRLHRSGNTSEKTCTQCRECLKKSLCRKSVKTKCIQCPPGSFVRLTRKEKICRGCRRCLKSVHHIRCANIVDLNCKLDCRHTTTDHRCKACSVCREDEFTKANCSATHNTVCKPCKRCKPSHFVHRKCSNQTDTQCRPCTKCRKGHTYIYKKCRGNKDTHCRQCSKCKPGHYVRKKCTIRHDTKCARCPSGTNCDRCPSGTYKSVHNRSMSRCVQCGAGRFMDKDQHFLTFCKTCRRCGPHELIVQACNITHDTRCGPCIPGYFRLSSSHNCAMCSPCPPNSTGLEVDECRQSTNASRICMPLTPLYDHHYQRSSPKDPPSKSASKDDSTMPLTPLYDHHYQRPSPTDPPFTSASKDDSTPPIPPTTSDFRIGTKLDDEKPLELDFETELNRETEPSQLPDKSTHDFVVILVVTLVISVLFIGITLVLVTKFNKKSRNLKRKVNSETVSMPTLFSTNSITDCFDLGALYKISNPKYNSDPDFHKADFRNVSEYSYPARNARVPKSRSMGTVDLMDVEFWRDW